MSAEQLLRELSMRLGLAFESQDWGIVNADPCRLREFIGFYESEPLSVTQRFELGGLIVASANERLLAGASESDEEIQVFVGFVRQHKDELSVHLTYWSDLQIDEEFPVATVLKGISRSPPG